jgi:hypothetical protein
MKYRKVVLGALAAAATLSSSMAFSSAADTSRVIHRVRGESPATCRNTGKETVCERNWLVDATQQADGTVVGQVTVRTPSGSDLVGVVTCLAVRGHEAWLSGVSWNIRSEKAEPSVFDAWVTGDGVKGKALPGRMSVIWNADGGVSCDQLDRTHDQFRSDYPMAPGKMSVS